MHLAHQLRKLFWRTGYDISRFAPTSHPLARRKRLLDTYHIDLVLDVGANTGQFARHLRSDLGYANQIVSFEPLSSAFKLLQESAAGAPNWEVHHFALGDRDEDREINIAGNSASSSLLDMLPSLLKTAPESKCIGRETIKIKRLDSIFGDLCQAAEHIYMKLDTQGFESRVLRGAERSLLKIDTVQMEMSLVPLYAGELLFPEMCMLMTEKGYRLVGMETGFSDPDSGELLQVDGIFRRSD